MNHAYDVNAAEEPVNVTVNGDLLARARRLKLDLSSTLEAALTALVTAHEQDQWKCQNLQAVQAYNQKVEEDGVFADGVRRF